MRVAGGRGVKEALVDRLKRRHRKILSALQSKGAQQLCLRPWPALVLSIAKLAGAITLSWWCVLAPAWIPVAGVVLCGAAILVTAPVAPAPAPGAVQVSTPYRPLPPVSAVTGILRRGLRAWSSRPRD